MAGRGATTFQKRQKEQGRREKREEKLARRSQRKGGGGGLDSMMGRPFDPMNPDADLASDDDDDVLPASEPASERV